MDEEPVSPPHRLRPTGRTTRGWPCNQPDLARQEKPEKPVRKEVRITASGRGVGVPNAPRRPGMRWLSPPQPLQAQRFTVGWVLEQDALLERLATTLRAVPSFRPRFILILAKLTH